MITLTETAAIKVKEIKTPEQALKVSVIGGGCSGLQYKLSLITLGEMSPTDSVFTSHDVSIVIDQKTGQFLAGTVIDHSDGLQGVGFTFSNPKATRSCGCGSSFACC